MVPVIDLSRRTAPQAEEFARLASEVLVSGHLLLGSRLAGFESEFAEFVHARRAVGVASGATAIQLALRALDIGPGDEVIVPAFTAVPTASAVCATGATPVPVDVRDGTATLDPEAALEAVTSRTRAIIPVHLYGRPSEIPSVSSPIAVVEDAAQAHGALRSLSGVAAAYSFYPTKNLGGVGDGGAIVTNDEAMADRLARLRVHGMVAQYVHAEVSQNFRMSELEATWLSLTLPLLEAANARRAAIARRYRAAAPHLRWQDDHPDHVYHLCVVRSVEREQLRAHLDQRGVATAIHYPLAITEQPAYRAFTRAACPIAERWAAECVSVPCFPELRDDEVETVAEALASLPASHGRSE